MPTTGEIRTAVIDAILSFAARLPLQYRAKKLPTAKSIRNSTKLSSLGITYTNLYKLGLALHLAKLSGHLHHTCTGHWKTVEDVVTSVISHPHDSRRSF